MFPVCKIPAARAQEAALAISLAVVLAPALTALTLGGFALRMNMLDRFPLREDEALYAYWALHGWLDDPLFLTAWPDKPPVFLWLLGAAFRLFGVSAASARWVNVAAGTLLIPIIGATANRLWGRRAALTAALLLALNPYAVSFGPTAYTDPLFVLAGMTAFCLAVYGRAFGAGLLLGAAIMTKQQGLLYVPLVMGGLWLAPEDRTLSFRHAGQKALLLAAGAALIVIPILYWDSLRWDVAPSPWDLSVRNYAPLALLAPSAWPARATEWGPLIFNLTASWPVWALLAALLAVGVWAGRRNSITSMAAPARSNLAFLLMAGWSFAYLAVHLATTVQAWDRYLLPLAPVLALGAGWAVSRLAPVLSGIKAGSLTVAMAVLLLAPAQQAASGHSAVGGDHGDYTGLPAAIQAVQQLSDGPFILYHRALGWHYRFYLYDEVRQQMVDLRWFPSSVYLADNAAKMPYPPKYLIEPDWAPLPNLEPHLTMRSLSLTDRGRYGRFRIWEIGRGPANACDWCVNRVSAPWTVHPSVPPSTDMTSP